MIWIALLVVVLALGAYIGVRIAENSHADTELADLIMSQQFLNELDRETARWRT